MQVQFAALLALCASLTACGDGVPFASFETGCAKPPPIHIEVLTVPLTIERDDSEPAAVLSAKNGSALDTQRTMGLTTAVFGQSTDIALSVGSDRRSHACDTPRARVELSMQPVTVYVARELTSQLCQHDATLSHEMKHVEVFRQALDRAARDLERDLPRALDAELERTVDSGELEQRFVLFLRDYMAQFMRERQRMLDEAQAEVDSPTEYARVSEACPA